MSFQNQLMPAAGAAGQTQPCLLQRQQQANSTYNDFPSTEGLIGQREDFKGHTLLINMVWNGQD